jgi:alpha-L-rhamnosidase
VLVASSEEKLKADEGDLWDSGQVVSDETVGIAYAGRRLSSRQSCWWKVRVWGRDGVESGWSPSSRWAMGLLDRSDWQAKWVSPSPVEPVTAPHFGYRSLKAGSGETVKWVQIDLGSRRTVDSVRLWGAWPVDGSRFPGDGFPLRFRIDFSDEPTFSASETAADLTGSDLPNPEKKPVRVPCVAAKTRYVRLTATRLCGERTVQWDEQTGAYVPRPATANGKGQPEGWTLALAEFEVFASGTNVARGCAVTASDSQESPVVGWSKSFLTDGRTEGDLGGSRRHRPVTLLRREFRVKRPVRRAILRSSALGCYEAHVNGNRAGDDELVPGITFNDRRSLYQTYDVTGLIQAGDNAVGVMLADGWRGARPIMDTRNSAKRFRFNDRPFVTQFGERWFVGQLELTYADGSREIIGTDRSWLCCGDGPMRRASMPDGLIYDARKEIAGWDGAAPVDRKVWGDRLTEAEIDSKPQLSAQAMPPIRVWQMVKPIGRTEPKPGHVVFDFGQNIAGVCRLTVAGAAGTTITLRHAETLRPDGTLDVKFLKGAYNNRDRYTLAGRGAETLEAKFTYHGFRYVEISGMSSFEAIRDLTALAFGSDVRKTTTLTASDPKIKALGTIIDRTYRSNMMGLIVDVAGRDERMPFLGDCFTDEIQSLAYLYDFAAFGAHENREIVDLSGSNGYPWLALKWRPEAETPAEAGWTDASVTTPWFLWVHYADRRALEVAYPGAARFMDTILRENPGHLPERLYKAKFGDWLSDTRKRMPDEVFAAAFWAYSADLVAQMAQALGKREDARRYGALRDEVRTALVKAYVAADGTVRGDNQSSYGMTLGMGHLPGELRERAEKRLLRAFEVYPRGLSSGTITTTYLLNALSEMGQHDLAYRRVMRPTGRSYGAMLESGATAMREAFDGAGGGLNHLGMNSVFGWMMAYVAGIRPDPDNPGYKHFFVGPKPGGDLTWVRARYDSVRGRIVSDWKIRDGLFTLRVVVPANTTATVLVPIGKSPSVTESGMAAGKAVGVTACGLENGCARFKVEAGEYRFESVLNSKERDTL